MNLLRSKITAPECQPNLISRPRLIQKITGSRKANLFVLNAPAGYGKTTLAVQLFSTLKGVPKAWYHIDRHDCEPSRFSFFFTEALALAVPALKIAGLGRAEDESKGDIGAIADDICFFFQEYDGPPCWFVLDNWETVDSVPAIGETLGRLIVNSGGKLRLIVNSRTRPAFKIRKLQESGKAIVISQRDLAFSLTEFGQAVKARIKSHVSEAKVEELWRFSGGWCVNVGLLLELLEHRGPEHSVSTISNLAVSETMFEYVEEELLRELPPDLLDFIVNCSVFETISAAACTAVMDNNGSIQENLRLLEESAIPHLSHAAKGAYRLHPMIRQSANRILRQKTPLDKLTTLYGKVSEYHLGQSDFINAIECLLELPDHHSVLKVIDEHWYSILESCGIGQIENWLHRFPAEFQHASLFVKLMSNALSIGGNNGLIMKYLADKIDPAAYEKGDTLLANSWVRYHWARLHSTHRPEYVSTVNEWDSLFEKCGPFPDSAIAGAELTLSCAAYMELRIADAKRHLEKCLEKIPEDNYVYRLNSQDNMAIFEQMLGRTQEALGILDRNNAESHKRQTIFGMADRYALMSWMYLSSGKYRKAFEVAIQGANIARYNDNYNVRTQMYLERCKGVSAWYLGDRVNAFDHLERALELASVANRREVAFNGLLIEYYSLLGGNPRAVIDKSDIPPRESPSEIRLLYLLKESTLAVISGKSDNLKRFASEILKISSNKELIPWIVTGNLLMAIWADMHGDPSSCRTYLTEGLTLMKEICWDTYLLAGDPVLAQIFVISTRMNILTDVTLKLVTGEQKINLAPAMRLELDSNRIGKNEKARLLTAARKCGVRGLINTAKELISSSNKEIRRAATAYLEFMETSTLPVIKINMLGRFSVNSGGIEVSFKREKSKLIFQMLILERPRPLHEEVLMEQFWPGSDPRKSKANLQTCIKDLRKSLDPYYEARGKSYVEYSNGHYSSALPEGSTIDIFEFKDILKKMRSRETDWHQSKIEEYWQALLQYGLEFLPEQRYESFTLEYRETLQKEFLENALICADMLISKNDFRRAVDLIERGLKIDPCWADGVQKMMLARAKSGEILAAMRIYREYEKRLQKELNLPPDKELKKYFENIMLAEM